MDQQITERADEFASHLANPLELPLELRDPPVDLAVPPLLLQGEAAQSNHVPSVEAAAYLRGFVAGWSRRRDEAEVRTVWSGPATPGVPVRATARVLTEVVSRARSELLAMTYAARRHPPLISALREAVARGVDVHVVETREGAAGLLDGPEPAAAFTAVPGLRLWHWAPEAREHERARQHAKLAVADRRVLLVGSANLTESGVRRNLEAGVIVTGGTAPQRAAEHIRELQRRGILMPLP
ncbi:DISARM system phospholipase D-like protein DrmC [Streptomyces sp. 11x1]|uniref:DISARM system phospholipase D-like protein DrmC n=1 Tax=Streptomyces sp. 11x1 TaxID=3038642 RepID=UPI00292EF156|nr:DISARM system phospholipase D-like protein DrmC [Streptomyces sp. 11x1]WNZ08703.1 DISARM system phospholipase D-like protein DrmC [Streptomyces sp. 11x1]